MKKLIIIMVALSLVVNNTNAQGCMAVRQIAGFWEFGKIEDRPAKNDWFFNMNNRYFKSFRTFIGTHDQKTPKKDQVINKTFTTDFTLLRELHNGWSLASNIPIAANTRSTTFEHAGKRHDTKSFGLGDIRITLYKWLLKTANGSKGNIQLGLGIKLPTGDYKYQDYFYLNDSTKILGPVDQSIQLGDGGTGITMEVNTIYKVSNIVNLYGNFFYLFNPREQNGVSTFRGGLPNALSIRAGSDVMSVPDQYTGRVGAAFTFHRFTGEAGIRAEGVPVNDFIGGKSGLRRAGYNISAEPGVSYRSKNCILYAYTPIALKRSIRQSVTDKKRTEITGSFAHSPGGFGDVLFFAGVAFKL